MCQTTNKMFNMQTISNNPTTSPIPSPLLTPSKVANQARHITIISSSKASNQGLVVNLIHIMSNQDKNLIKINPDGKF